MEEPGEYKPKSKYNLPEEVVENIDLLMSIDQETVARIVKCSFIAGLQLAMRICRNRAKDGKEMRAMTMVEAEANRCAELIRICQVELGAGRMERPNFTQEEIDEMDRAS